ncbi:MAG: M24 family metallopeptidase [Dehalococcoidia bacterium]
MVKALHQRDLVGAQVVDFDERVDIRRLRRQRIGRLQAEIAKADLGAALLFDPVNVRYATGTRLLETFALRFKGRHALVPREGPPILFQANEMDEAAVGDDVICRPMHTFEFWQTGSYVNDATAKWAQLMKETLLDLSLAGERLGIDRLDAISVLALQELDVNLADAVQPLGMARAIKTVDELALIRQACAIADVALWNVQQAIEPGVTEEELFAVMMETNLRYGGERIDGKLLAAGGNTNPWLKREASNRMVRSGDLVAIDTDMAGPMDYFADISRTYLCGDGRPNEEQMDAYKRAYDFLYTSIPLFKPCTAFQEIAEKVPEVPEEYKANRYVVLAHGAGMSDEWPALYFPDTSETGFGNYPGELQEHMVICMEASFGREGGREQVKLEEQMIITARGPEVISQAPFDWRFF